MKDVSQTNRKSKGASKIPENEKKLEQAKHRLEEAEMRDRVKERKARTHRLIMYGAALESVMPDVKDMDEDKLKI